MKISKKDFEEMRAKYDAEVRIGKPAQTLTGENTDQTRWVFFDRETLEGLLKQADEDPKKGGIQMFLTEYTKNTADDEKLVGALTLVLCAANLEGNIPTTIASAAGEVTYENKGQMCPPNCE